MSWSESGFFETPCRMLIHVRCPRKNATSLGLLDDFPAVSALYHDVYSMLALALPKPKNQNRSLRLIRNSYLLNKQLLIRLG
jgi:hypothetical protein